MEAIKTINLTKRYKDCLAVDGLNLEIREGEIFALLGVNGAGKTTTVKMLSCLTSPSEGDALLLGMSILGDRERVKSIIAVSPQESAVAPMLTVRENLGLMCDAQGFDRQTASARIGEILKLLSLSEVEKRRAGKLSGGYQRRLSIAMALICEPKILFLDEPTLGLDVISRSELWDLICSIKGRTTVILTTHYMEEAEALSDRIGIMKDGRLLTVGTAEEIKARTGEAKFEDAFIKIVREYEK